MTPCISTRTSSWRSTSPCWLNNGHPTTLARFLDFLAIRAGDRVLHVGCGVGYYTAIIAEIVGPYGHVDGDRARPRCPRTRQPLPLLLRRGSARRRGSVRRGFPRR
ncbi:MAG TPA: hypothetical protein DEP35_10195, partial [Deltaproteobacteria bacterium]|nr:hypothetical protein [Deltaproteobacteria bacterium]